MFNHIRLTFTALFMGLFLVACGDDNSQQDAAENTAAPAEMAADSMSTEKEAMSEESMSSIEGMTEEEAVAKWGEPDVTQSYTIDSLTITHHEWHAENGITAVQFQNGVAKFSQFIPAK